MALYMVELLVGGDAQIGKQTATTDTGDGGKNIIFCKVNSVSNYQSSNSLIFLIDRHFHYEQISHIFDR